MEEGRGTPCKLPAPARGEGPAFLSAEKPQIYQLFNYMEELLAYSSDDEAQEPEGNATGGWEQALRDTCSELLGTECATSATCSASWRAPPRQSTSIRPRGWQLRNACLHHRSAGAVAAGGRAGACKFALLLHKGKRRVQ